MTITTNKQQQHYTQQTKPKTICQKTYHNNKMLTTYTAHDYLIGFFLLLWYYAKNKKKYQKNRKESLKNNQENQQEIKQ